MESSIALAHYHIGKLMKNSNYHKELRAICLLRGFKFNSQPYTHLCFFPCSSVLEFLQLKPALVEQGPFFNTFVPT